MEYKKIVPAVALTLGVAASLQTAALANPIQTNGLFQMNEVSAQGMLVANHHDDEHKCGSDHKCGGDKGEHKCGSGHDGHDGHDGDHGDDKCGAGACGSDHDHDKH